MATRTVSQILDKKTLIEESGECDSLKLKRESTIKPVSRKSDLSQIQDNQKSESNDGIDKGTISLL